MKKVFSFGLLIAAIVLVAFSSCKPGNTVKNVTKVRLSEQTKTIKVDEEFTLKATVSPADAANKEVTWTSDQPTIASVDNNGKVKGLAIGEATITVTTVDGNKTATCKVTVIDKNQATETDIYLFGYRGNLGAEGKHFYTIILTDKGMVNGDDVKDGPCYYFTFCSDAPKSDKDFTPRMGTYQMGEKGQLEPMFIVKHDKFTYAGKFISKKITTISPFVEGELVVEANKITFKGKDAADKEYKIAFAGTYVVKDLSPKPFGMEPTQQTTITKEWNSGQLTFGKIEGNVKPIDMENGLDNDSILCWARFYVDKNATKLPEGTYNVNDTKAANTVSKSKGVEGNKVTPSILCKVIESEGKIYISDPIYFFDNGTVTVTATDITFNVKSHFGSTLNLKYTGPMDVKNEAPKRAMAPIKTRKALKF
jgi:pullulanase family protein